ncbi:GIY-YIG nuclease family protein [Salmonella enterica]|nr:GIY-YIG nuclease family protein [Salmonella enterica]EDD4939563.1 hypothetical protein [Salmonella enterica subsp. enterica serovar Typhimurium]EBB1528194.1 GIY-YIG nuclease family protein [Salmonella enterica]EBE7790340.1 GIY-YIG nuclease family protein [Salmonella enterica]EBQ7327435.1 GIY-YIG nuclease family protein [Salmonella enterica]
MCQHHYIKASEIEQSRKFHHSAVLPSVYEIRIIARCVEINYLYMGFIGEWNGKKTRVMMTCDKGHVFDTSIDSFLNTGSKCMQCYLDSKKMNEDEALARVTEMLDGYTLVGFVNGYNGANNKTRLHLICPNGHEYKPLFKNFVYGSMRCGRCSGKAKYDMVDIMQHINEVRGDHEFVRIVGEWKGTNHSIIVMRCPSGHEYEINYRNFVINGNRCAKCAGNAKLTEDEALARIDECRDDHTFIRFVDGWKGTTTTRIIMRCTCGYEYTLAFNNFLRGRRCAKCASHGYNIGKAGHVYVQHIPEVNAVKIGITNRTPEQRKRQHELESKLKHEIVFSWRFDDGNKAKLVEDEFKKKYKHLMKFVSKEVMPDGYTETLPADILHTFLKDVKSMCNLVRI